MELSTWVSAYPALPQKGACLPRCHPQRARWQPPADGYPLPFQIPIPFPQLLRGPAPAPPPVCDGGRGAGRAERSGAEQTPPPDPMLAR